MLIMRIAFVTKSSEVVDIKSILSSLRRSRI